MSTHTLSTRSSSESFQSNSSSITVPEKLAPAVSGAMVWQGNELDPTKYVLKLTDQEIAKIRAAVISFSLTKLPRSAINKETFNLHDDNLALVDKLSKISKELHQGQGVFVLRGLDTAKFNDVEAVIAFVGVCSYVCAERATDSYANQTLSHVRDATQDSIPSSAKNIGLAGSKITAPMDFHSDRFSGDVIALHVRHDGGASNGGEQYVASFWRIYNELLRTEPEILEDMAKSDWPFELKQKASAPHLEEGPILFFSKGKPICQMVKAPLLGTATIPRDVSMPKVSDKQKRVLEKVEKLAQSLRTKLDRRPGDIQFFHNLSVLHSREGYHGEKGRASERHLLRMFLRDPDYAWEKPAAWRYKFDNPFTLGRSQNIPVHDTDPRRLISGRESHG